MSWRRATSASACLLVAAFLAAGCGGSSDTSTSIAATAPGKPALPKSAFPQTEGRTLQELVKDQDSHAELVVSPAALTFDKGENRYPFGVFEPDRSQIDDAEVALYVAKVPPPKGGNGGVGKNGRQKKGALARAREEGLEQPAVGPYPATIESLATQPAYRAQTTTSDPDAATVVYSADVDCD